MIQDTSNTLTEGKAAPRKNMFTLLTALAVFKPGSLSFLNNVKNRYTLTSQVLNQALYHELLTAHELTLDFEVQPGDFSFDVEKDWNRLQKCAKAALAIHREFENVEGITLHADDSLTIATPSGAQSIQTKQTPTTKQDLFELLGILPEDAMQQNAFVELIKHWLNSLNQGLKADYARALHQLCPFETVNSFAQYKSTKLSGLGVRVDAMPKLYYNSIYQFSLDVVKFPAAFHNYDNFIERWRELLDSHLNQDILLPALLANKDRRSKFTATVSKLQSLQGAAYYRFDANQHLYQVGDAQTVTGELSAQKLSQKYYINKNRQLVLSINQGGSGTLKIMAGMESMAPSPLKIQYRYEK